MIALGILLILAGWLVGIGALTTIGVALLAIGLVLMFMGRPGPIGGRWY